MRIQGSTCYFVGVTALLAGCTYRLLRNHLPSTTVKVQLIAIMVTGAVQLVAAKDLGVVMIAPFVVMGVACAWGKTSLKVAALSVFSFGFIQLFLGGCYHTYLPTQFLDNYGASKELSDDWFTEWTSISEKNIFDTTACNESFLNFCSKTIEKDKKINLSEPNQKEMIKMIKNLKGENNSWAADHPHPFLLLVRLDHDVNYHDEIKSTLEKIDFPMKKDFMEYVFAHQLLPEDERQPIWEKVLEQTYAFRSSARGTAITGLMRVASRFFGYEEAVKKLNAISLEHRQAMDNNNDTTSYGDLYLGWWIVILCESQEEKAFHMIQKPEAKHLQFAESSKETQEGISVDVLTWALRLIPDKSKHKTPIIDYLRDNLKGFKDLEKLLPSPH